MRITTADAPTTPTTRVSRADDDTMNGAGPSAGAQFLAVLAGLTPQSSQPATPTSPPPARGAAGATPGASTHAATAPGGNDPNSAPAPLPATNEQQTDAPVAASVTPVAAPDRVGADAPGSPNAATAAATTRVDANLAAGDPAAPTPVTSAATQPAPATLPRDDVAPPAAPTAAPIGAATADPASRHIGTANGAATDASTVAPDDDPTPQAGPSPASARGTTTAAPTPTTATSTTAAAATAQPVSPTTSDGGPHDGTHDDAPGARPSSATTATATATATSTASGHDSSTAPAPAPSHAAQPSNPTVATPAIATPQPTANPTQVAAPPAPAAPPNPVATTPVAQLVSVVEPLRDQPDGSYRITVDLHPADLGRVQVEVRLERGEVNLHLQADHASTSALLRDALHDLRDGLQSAGLRTGGVVVSNGDAARHGSADAAERDTANAANRDGTTSRSGTDDVTDVATTGPAYAPTSSDALVDVRV